MKRIRIILLYVALLFTNVNGVGAQEHWDNIADTLRRYGAPATYMYDDSVRSWLIERELAVGYVQCYNDYYELLSQVAEQTRQQMDSLMYDLGMSRILMGWQHNAISTDSAHMAMQYMKDLCLQRYGKQSYTYTTASCIMGQFLCSIGHFDEADSCCRRIINYDNNLVVYRWQYSMALHTKMVADVGRGRLTDAWETAEKIIERYNKEENTQDLRWPDNDDYLKKLEQQVSNPKKAARLASQITAPMLPPSPKAIATNDIDPLPLYLPPEMMTSRPQAILGVFLLSELLFHLRLSNDYCSYMNAETDNLNKKLYDYEFFNGVTPAIAADLCRRSASIASKYAELFDTTHYPHNQEPNEVIKRWQHCMATELLNFSEPSAEGLLRYSTEWIKKGYPLSMLPLVEEAAATMRRNLNDQHPTMRQMVLRRHDREWLVTELPKLLPLVVAIPDYAIVTEELKTLAKEYQK